MFPIRDFVIRNKHISAAMASMPLNTTFRLDCAGASSIL